MMKVDKRHTSQTIAGAVLGTFTVTQISVLLHRTGGLRQIFKTSSNDCKVTKFFINTLVQSEVIIIRNYYLHKDFVNLGKILKLSLYAPRTAPANVCGG